MTNSELCELAAKCWFLTGATASGKTRVSLTMARLLDAEIISLDSMAIYRGMDIGTAKPALSDQQLVPHHMLDIIEPMEAFSVSQYRDRSMEIVRQVRERNKQVIFVGGTALYLKALLRGMFEGPPADWDFRQEIEQELDEMGGDFLHQRLEMIDPVSAANLHPNDHRRLIRALEVFKTTGKPISHWQMQFSEGKESEDCRVFTLRHARPVLHERIENRVTSMFEAGLLDEVQGLLDKHGSLGQTAAQAVGYREAIDHLEGRLTWDQTIEKVRVRTRKFARHQETWFRGLSECRMIDLPTEFDSDQIAEQLVAIGQQVK